MTRLSVNLNKVALLRNSRALGIPSVVRAGEIVLDAGARGQFPSKRYLQDSSLAISDDGPAV